MPEFVHLHCHTQYSLLDGAADIDAYMQKAKADNMKGLAITDHGNMFGVFKFYDSAQRHGLTPIMGCEFYVVEDRFKQEFKNGNKDKRYHQLMLAKNAEGYKNLSKLCSLGFIEGLYGKFPRIDKELIRKYKDGIIATTCCVAAEVPQTFLNKGPEEAEKVFLEWLDIFGEDYYVELQRHSLHGIDQEGVNRFMLQMARKHNVPVVCTNDSHYVEQEDWLAHDILLCINTGDFQSTPVGDRKGDHIEGLRALVDGNWIYDTPSKLRQHFRQDPGVQKMLAALEVNRNRPRFGFENDQFYFKTTAEMAELFNDIPEALDNTVRILEKIEPPDLKRDILLPNYVLPEGYDTQDSYLKYLTFERAKQRYGELTGPLTERLEYELKVIQDMGFSGYFLIVQDFVQAAKERGVWVGPGRGSAAGSAIAYVLGITNIDPIKYNLLFERFLNPERISMPDIDIDFDDANRQKVMDYVIDKYGKNQVAQIITYGTMAAKSSIRDVGRVLQYPLGDTDKLAKMVPDRAKDLKAAFKENKDLGEIRKKETSDPGKVLKLAEKLEGSIRQRGIHAAGVIIAPDDLTEYIPVCTAPDSDLLVTQFDGNVIESAGMLKMDFLGLKTLSIIADAVQMIKDNRGTEIDIDQIPLDDENTLELYQRGDTIATFQFESEGMRKYLRDLKPTSLEDLIAMNALYRPGPMEHIPSFIARKHGVDKVEYPHPLLKEILQPTYGIMVYQEQIMQTAQIIGGFSLGKADILRRAMGKKKMDVMRAMKEEFVEGAKTKDIQPAQSEEIFTLMEKFAQYGFNRSHSAAYTVLAFQTAYLKANFPAEYMAAVLTHNMSDIKKLNFFLGECRRMGINTLGPDINESQLNFSVNEEEEIRFALAGIKGVGQAAVEAIVEERQANSKYQNIFDLTKRVNLRAVNKKCLESLAMAGAFDSFGFKRSQYFGHLDDQQLLLEKAVRFGQQYQQQQQTTQHSLFGESVMVATVDTPAMPETSPWSLLEKLNKELQVTGMYISGHPLDDFQFELENLCTTVAKLDKCKNQECRIGGMVKNVTIKMDRRGQPFGIFEVEDYTGATKMMLFKENFLKYKHLLEEGKTVICMGRYQTRYNSEDEFEFSPNTVELLSEALDKYAKGIRIDIPVRSLSDKLMNRLEEVLMSHPGSSSVRFCLVDKTEGMQLPFICRKHQVTLEPDLMKHLEKVSEVEIHLMV